MFYTAQYRYGGADRLDITVKGNDPVGRVFAPTWDMVSNWMEAKKLSTKLNQPDILKNAEELYKIQYKVLMRDSVRVHHAIWLDVLNRPEVTLVCFCPAGSFCHRYQLADMFQAMGIFYGSERVG